MAFENKVPVWNAPGAEPPDTLKNTGFSVGYKPPADYFNWFWHNVSQCLNELQDAVSNAGNSFFTTIDADTTDAFFLELSKRMYAKMEASDLLSFGSIHNTKDFYFGMSYKNGSYLWGFAYGGLNKIGYFFTYNSSTGAVALRNLPNEDFPALKTNNKANLVGSINEIHTEIDALKLYGNFTADDISGYLKQVCASVNEKADGCCIYRGAHTGRKYYVGTFYKASSFVFGTICDHDGSFYFCTYNPSTDVLSYDIVGVDTHPASDITAGTFAGQVVANSSGQSPGVYLVRNQKLSATEETPSVNGAICWVYE